MMGKLALVLAAFCGFTAAQNWTIWQGPKDGPRLRAELWNQVQNAKLHQAYVEVEVQNVWIHSPDAAPQPGIQEAVLRYELDRCPAIVTTDTRLRFERLPSGTHVITVGLIGKTNLPISPAAKLQVTVP